LTLPTIKEQNGFVQGFASRERDAQTPFQARRGQIVEPKGLVGKEVRRFSRRED